MGSGIFNSKAGGHTNTEQNTKAHGNKGAIGNRSHNLVNLIGADRVSRRDYKYEGTYYMTENGEVYDNHYMNYHNPYRTGVSFYEVIDWLYNESKQMYEPTIRRVVMIRMREYQLTLNL